MYLELKCIKEDCYVYEVLQMVPDDMELTCHNCGSILVEWVPHSSLTDRSFMRERHAP